MCTRTSGCSQEGLSAVWKSILSGAGEIYYVSIRVMVSEGNPENNQTLRYTDCGLGAKWN